MNELYIDVEKDWLRDVISGKTKFRKCYNCDTEGIEHQRYNYNGNPCNPDDTEATTYMCEICDGLAYIELPD